MVAGLRQDPKVRELLEETACKPGTFAISDKGIESAQCHRIAEGSGKDSDVDALSQATYTCGLLVRMMDVIENRDAHARTSSTNGTAAILRVLVE
jgi:hypothetical protein